MLNWPQIFAVSPSIKQLHQADYISVLGYKAGVSKSSIPNMLYKSIKGETDLE